MRSVKVSKLWDMSVMLSLSTSQTTGQLMFITKVVLEVCGGFNSDYVGHGYEHLEYSRRIHHALGYEPFFFDSFEGNLCIYPQKVKTAATSPACKRNKKLYKSFLRHYKKSFESYRYREYKQ